MQNCPRKVLCDYDLDYRRGQIIHPAPHPVPHPDHQYSSTTSLEHSSTSPRHSVKVGYPISLPTYIISRPLPVDIVPPNPKTQGLKLALQIRKYLPTYTSFRIHKGKIETRQPDYSQCSSFPLGMVFSSILHPALLFFHTCFRKGEDGGGMGRSQAPKQNSNQPIPFSPSSIYSSTYLCPFSYIR